MTWSIATIAATLLSACNSPPDSTSAQAEDDSTLVSEVIFRGPDCDRCTIEFTRLGRMGGPADSVVLTRETQFALRGDGRIVAAPTLVVGEAAIFDSIGASPRPYGRAGDGPGENARILNVLPWVHNTVLLVGSERVTIVGGGHGEGRTLPLKRVSASPRTVGIPKDDVVVRNYEFPPDREFVVFNLDGTIRAEMGDAWISGRMEDLYETTGELGPATRPHAFWSAPQRYRIEMNLWDARNGTLLRRLQDTVPWYTPYDSAQLTDFIFAGTGAVNPPPPFLRGIRESSDSLLWQVYNVPARNWTAADSIPARYWGFRRQAYDGVIDVRDPVSGQELIAVWTNMPFTWLVNDSLLAYRHDTEDGFWVYDIYKFKLQRGG